MRRAAYRARQFFEAVRAAPEAVDAGVLGLAPEQYVLWSSQSAADRRHTFAVWNTLRQAGHTDPDLLRAALLHDLAKTVARQESSSNRGKVERFRLWHRCAVVVLRAAAPGLLARLSRRADPASWRYPFYLSRNHAELSAQLAQQADCPTRTVALIRWHSDGAAPQHDDPELARLLRILYRADDQN